MKGSLSLHVCSSDTMTSARRRPASGRDRVDHSVDHRPSSDDLINRARLSLPGPRGVAGSGGEGRGGATSAPPPQLHLHHGAPSLFSAPDPAASRYGRNSSPADLRPCRSKALAADPRPCRSAAPKAGRVISFMGQTCETRVRVCGTGGGRWRGGREGGRERERERESDVQGAEGIVGLGGRM